MVSFCGYLLCFLCIIDLELCHMESLIRSYFFSKILIVRSPPAQKLIYNTWTLFWDKVYHLGLGWWWRHCAIVTLTCYCHSRVPQTTYERRQWSWHHVFSIDLRISKVNWCSSVTDLWRLHDLWNSTRVMELNIWNMELNWTRKDYVYGKC